MKLKLPKAVEGDPRHESIALLLSSSPVIPCGPQLVATLQNILKEGHLVRGLEQIETYLAREKKGLDAVQKKTGDNPTRVSRLLLVSNDGSERFYRSCEKILSQNRNRLLIVRLDEASESFSEKVSGLKDKELKALLVADRDAVTQVLFSLC